LLDAPHRTQAEGPELGAFSNPDTLLKDGGPRPASLFNGLRCLGREVEAHTPLIEDGCPKQKRFVGHPSLLIQRLSGPWHLMETENGLFKLFFKNHWSACQKQAKAPCYWSPPRFPRTSVFSHTSFFKASPFFKALPTR